MGENFCDRWKIITFSPHPVDLDCLPPTLDVDSVKTIEPLWVDDCDEGAQKIEKLTRAKVAQSIIARRFCEKNTIFLNFTLNVYSEAIDNKKSIMSEMRKKVKNCIKLRRTRRPIIEDF
jgi:hypothetical protein